MKSVPAFKTEAELCAAFVGALPQDWCAYPETGGWDLLLVRKNDGCQIGIEAKLKLNAKVLCQAAETRFGMQEICDPGPDYRAVLVPDGCGGELASLAVYCGLTVISMRPEPPRGIHYPRFSPSLPAENPADSMDNRYWHEMMPTQRCPLPEYVPDVVAGASAPVQLTEWKIQALKLAILMDSTGYLTRDDFKRLRVDIRRWLGNWLEPHPEVNGFRARGDFVESLRRQHPLVWEEISADPEKWRRPEKRIPW